MLEVNISEIFKALYYRNDLPKSVNNSYCP